MKLTRILATWLLALAPLPFAHAQAADQNGTLAHIRQRMQSADFRASGRLVKVDATGNRTNYKLRLLGHWFPDGLHLLYDLTGPTSTHTRIAARMDATGSLHTAYARTSSVAGTDFALEDLAETQFFWSRQQLLQQAPCASRTCFVIFSKPDKEARSSYASTTSHVDRDTFIPIHVTKTLRTGGVKELSYSGLRRTGGVWAATQIEAALSEHAGSSLLILEHGTPHAHLTLKDFTAPAADDASHAAEEP